MRDFGRQNRFGNKRDFGNRDRREPREMFDAICSNCGKPCKVPFRPTGSKPVLCSDCFEKQNPEKSRGFHSDNRDDRRSFDKPQQFGGRSQERSFQPRGSFQDTSSRSELDAINAKLDSILALLNTKEVPASPAMSETIEKPKRKTVKKVFAEESTE